MLSSFRTLKTLRLFVTLLATTVLAGSAAPALAQVSPADAVILDARDALRKHDRARLAADRAAALVGQHPLAQWVDYWEVGNRLSEVQPDEVEAFYARWSGTYVEDRLRNDWLLELGRRRDWADFARDYPRFRMNDDREVTCYALLTDHLAGRNVTDAARAAWAAQRDLDDGCALLATTLAADKRLTSDDIWRVAQRALEANRPRVAKFAVGLINPPTATAANTANAAAVTDLLDNPARYLARRANANSHTASELATLALMRMAWNDPDAAAGQLEQRWQAALPGDLAGVAWTAVARQAASKLIPEAASYYQIAWRATHKPGQPSPPDQGWSDDTLAWGARAALRSPRESERWPMVLQMIGAMDPVAQKDPTWVYWKSRALATQAKPGAEGDIIRTESRRMMASIVDPFSFYGLLAADDIGQPLTLPPRPLPPTPAEQQAAQSQPGIARSLMLIGLGLRSEGVREWNFSLRGLGERELLATAALACSREVWDRCINTSDRTRNEIDLGQRYPMPFRAEVVANASAVGIDPAFVYGLIRQESRFVMDARSGVGAAGLMQVMPATAKWTAKKLGWPYSPDMITDRSVNIRIGTGYLKLVLDDFGGSQALSAAAYNAGPNRPRRWRDGPMLEPAIWAENVPFPETRDYVKKVLSNAAIYAALIGNQPVSLKARLGGPIGPRDASAPTAASDPPPAEPEKP